MDSYGDGGWVAIDSCWGRLRRNAGCGESTWPDLAECADDDVVIESRISEFPEAPEALMPASNVYGW